MSAGNDYKILLSNKDIYKEVELSADMDSLRIGTGLECDVRLRKELFFAQFNIDFYLQDGAWNVRCSDNIYISEGDVRKLLTKTLTHGERFSLKYRSSENELLTLHFSVDFERTDKNYDRVINVSDIDSLHIGGGYNCDVKCSDELIGTDFMSLQRRGIDYYIMDNDTRYGVYLNGNRIVREAVLHDYDFISINGFSFFFKHEKLYGSTDPNVVVSGALNSDVMIHSRSSLEYPKFNRNSRIKPVIPDDPLPILDPPAKPQKQTTNIVTALMPILGMLAVVVLLRGVMGGSQGSYIWMSVAMMSVGGLTTIATFFTGKGKFKKDTKERVEKYNKYIGTKKQDFTKYRNEELSLLNETYKSQNANIEAVFDFSGELFDRKSSDEDYLFVNLGSGVREAIRKIDYKKKESFSTDDELMGIPESLSEEFRYIADAPVTVDLKNSNAIGIVGAWQSLFEILKNITIDVSTRQYYDDVKTFYVINEAYADRFMWLRFSPHIVNDQLNMRNIAYDADSRVPMFEYLYKEFSYREGTKDAHHPDFIIFLFNDTGFKHHPVSKYVEKASEINVTFVFFEANREHLPQHCDEIITIYENGSANILKSDDRNKTADFIYDTVDDSVVAQLMLKLSPVYCEDVSLESSLTKNISLFNLLGIYGVDDLDLGLRWQSSKVFKSMAAPLGVKTKNEIVSLDLHEKAHGPHGLVAGTTGSGKSEILQSYILSAATLFHPYDIAFVIIDFKGGGMVNQFKELPHLVGAITNIDGKEIDRSLLSIKAELTKRQALFAEADVNHIDKYIMKYKSGEVPTALPHLVIIVDEFAELKAEQPEFMKELISAARIGRSLGVHLILATQKPAGQVNEQIWSNSRFKLCLKVQTQEDSNEVLKSPLAAEILEPGRAYFQVGNNEIFELFQSAYSGSPEKVDGESAKAKAFYLADVDLAGRRRVVYAQNPASQEGENRTQLNAVVDYVHEYCAKSNIAKLPDICLPPLPELIGFPEDVHVAAEPGEYKIEFGVYDDPKNQYQGPASIDIAEGNTLIIGSSQYGKTNLIQSTIRSLATRYTPDEINIYILDFASMVLKTFELLNHVGGVVTSSEDEKLKNLFKLLNEEIVIRKEKLIAVGVSSFSAYKEAGFADMPLIVLAIDNLTMLKELYLQDEDPLLGICREGVSVGISVMIANAQTSGIGFRYLANFSHRIALYNNDSGEYNNLFDYCRMQPENLPGRCLVDIDKTLYEAQTFLAFEGEKEIDRVNNVRAFINEMNERYEDREAKRIPEIPRVLHDDYLAKHFLSDFNPYHICIGLDYSSVEPVCFDFTTIGMLGIVSAAENAQKYEFVRRIVRKMIDNDADAPVRINIIDDFERGFEYLANDRENIHYTTVPSDILGIITDWEGELSGRYDRMAEGGKDQLKDAPLLLLLINSGDAIKCLGENLDAMNKFKDIIARYKSLKVAIICSAVENAPITYSSPEALKTFKEYGTILYYGNLNSFKVFDPPYAEVKRFKKPVEKDDAYWIGENHIEKVKTVSEKVC